MEGQNFRETMARLRYLERKKKKEQEIDTDEFLRSVNLAEMQTPFQVPNPLMASVTFPLIKFKKTVILKGKNKKNNKNENNFSKFLFTFYRR